MSILEGIYGSWADLRWRPVANFDELIEVEANERFRRLLRAYMDGAIEREPLRDRTWFWWLRRERVRLLKAEGILR